MRTTVMTHFVGFRAAEEGHRLRSSHGPVDLVVDVTADATEWLLSGADDAIAVPRRRNMHTAPSSMRRRVGMGLCFSP
jgi:hypothetical protein